MSQIGPQPGQPAPDFTLPVTGGGEITLSALRGAPVVLFFYPRDDTPGCTKETIGFSERLSEFAEAGVQVFGISRDSMDKHDKFAAKHALTVPLLSDTDGAVTEAYEVWVGKKHVRQEIHGHRTRDLSDRRDRPDRAGLAQGEGARPCGCRA